VKLSPANHGFGGLRATSIPCALALMLLLAACNSEGGPGGDVQAGADTTGGVDTSAPPADVAIESCGDPPVSCTPGAPHCDPTRGCVACRNDGHCGDQQRCDQGVCVPTTCTPGETRCDGADVLACAFDGRSWSRATCPNGSCIDGACSGCTPNSRLCDGDDVRQCLADGVTTQVVTTCTNGRTCHEGACVSCIPDARRCGANGTVETCSDDGVWETTRSCGSEGLVCQAGTCVSACSRDPKSRSNAGCDYWAVDLDNHWGARDSTYAIIVSNLGDISARVTVTRRDDVTSTPVEVETRDVAPGALAIMTLPNRNLPGAGVYWSAYRVVSTAPIVAYQFNPLDNVNVFSNDATLLLPGNTFGTEYIVMSRFEFLGGGASPALPVPYRGTISVVASASATDVTIRPTARTLAGQNMQTMMPGQSYTYALEPYQVLNIRSDQDKGDLTGTIITATKPIGVFSGHEAAITSQHCCADHLEHQLYPVSTWGQTYIASRSTPRQSESDYWRIVAATDDTVVSFEPATVSPPRALRRGEWFEFTSNRDFLITSTKPVMVGQILASSSEIVSPPAYSDCSTTFRCAPNYVCDLDGNTFSYNCFPPRCSAGGTTAGCPAGHVCHCFENGSCGCAPIGDPSLILLPPVEQFRDDYVFLAPNKYAFDYINIVAPAGATVTLDGQAVAPATWVTLNADWKVARMQVADGVHRLTATAPVGVIAYGYDKDVSYGYAAGLNLVDR
jgi:hypothetical protein